MSRERIVATALFIVDRDSGLQGGNIKFRRAWSKNEGAHIYYNDVLDVNEKQISGKVSQKSRVFPSFLHVLREI